MVATCKLTVGPAVQQSQTLSDYGYVQRSLGTLISEVVILGSTPQPSLSLKHQRLGPGPWALS